jgi:eukaryotic-like serine/threonine-protein kinase
MSDGIAASDTTREAGLNLAGRRLGDFQLLRRLGRGGMAEVYLAEQVSLRRQVALKVLLPALAQDPAYLRRFHHEAQSAASLVHANIVQIYEVGCIDGVHFISQEYVAGQNLKQFLGRKGPLDILAAVNIMRQVAAGLHRAGQRGVVHRDIKPENILIAPGGDVKVADFGLARAFNQASELTQVGVTMGTPLYMSPEQVEGNEVDPRSDIYSFGVTCYQMLTGRPPFDGESPLSIAVQHLKKAPERLENLRPDAPEGLCRIVHKMLAKAPQDRYQNAGEVLRDIRDLRLEGGDAEWAAALEDWSTAEMAAVSSARMEATQQLDSLMKTAARTRITYRKYVVSAALGAAAAFLIGAAAAWAVRPGDLLEYDLAELPPVPKAETVQAQLYNARKVHTVSGYRAVEEYFPEETYYVHLSWRMLAKLHLEEGELDAAMRLYRQLAALPETERHFRAYGLAGQLAVHVRRGETGQAAARYRELQPLLGELRDPELDKVVQDFGRNLDARLHRGEEAIQSAE